MIFQHIESMGVEETMKVESRYIRDNGGRLLQDKELIVELYISIIEKILVAYIHTNERAAKLYYL